ncbi:glycosyltransferase family 4 protein [Luedemannella flava]
MITEWFPPEPAFIPGGLAPELAARGHDVRVLTGFPAYPLGRTYPGHRQRWRHVESGAVGAGTLTVRRVPAYPSHDLSAARRSLTYLSFAATSAIAARSFLRDVDVVYVHHPPATAYAAALALGRVPTVVHVQDMWPESVTASGMTPGGRAGAALYRTLDATMRGIYRRADQLIAISPTMADVLVRRGADPGRTRVVLNWAEEGNLRPVHLTAAERAELVAPEKCTVLFAGNIGEFQRVETAIRAAAATPGVDLVFVGSGTREAAARAYAAQLGATNVRFLGRRPVQEMARISAAADFHLVILRDLPVFRGMIPSKVQAALCCGAPLIVSVAGDCAELVTTARLGFACPPEDWQALAAAFAAAAATPAAERAGMVERALRTYAERMSLRSGADQIEDVLTKAVGPRPRTRRERSRP